MVVKSLVHGAVSIVSAIATGNGATLGIDTFVKTELYFKPLFLGVFCYEISIHNSL